jgi:molecular chaperone DnaK
VEIHVLQGERPMARDNRTLGRFHLTGLPPAPRGVPQIEVAFDIDANGIVSVSAKDQATGREQKITVTASSGLSKDEIDRLVRDASSHVDEDRQRRELVDARNEADALAYQVEKTLGENRAKLGDADARRLDEAVAEARQAAGAEDVARIKRATEQLQHASHAMAQALYQQTQSGGEAPGGGARGGDVKEGEVVDAE